MPIRFLRVSRDEQVHSIQLDVLRHLGPETVVTETASGANRGRPQLTAALAAASEGDTLVVWKTDREARTDVELTVEALGVSRAIGYRTLTDPDDASTPTGRIEFHLLTAFARPDRTLPQDWTREGLKAARACGQAGGRPNDLPHKGVNPARGLFRDRASSFKIVAEEFGALESTLRAYFPSGRRKLLEAIAVEKHNSVFTNRGAANEAAVCVSDMVG